MDYIMLWHDSKLFHAGCNGRAIWLNAALRNGDAIGAHDVLGVHGEKFRNGDVARCGSCGRALLRGLIVPPAFVKPMTYS